jgi:hypothetical protein
MMWKLDIYKQNIKAKPISFTNYKDKLRTDWILKFETQNYITTRTKHRGKWISTWECAMIYFAQIYKNETNNRQVDYIKLESLCSI